MSPKDQPTCQLRFGLSGLLLLGLVLLFAYSNSFDASWHLDDYDNIVGNRQVHVEKSASEILLKPLQSIHGGGSLNRPVAFVTFAANWYFSGSNTASYHVVNVLIHILAAFVLFQTIACLYNTPKLKGTKDPSSIQFISLLAAMLWAVNPIHVQSVTYIVQRMASLCGLFYILSIYFYIRARLAEGNTQRFLLLATSLVSFVLGFFVKENAITLPLSLVLIEAVFFQNLANRLARRRLIGVASALVFAVVAVGFILYFKNGLPDLLASFGNRYFGPWERLLTQPRVLIFYLSLIFYPSPMRLSLVHDFEISTSALTPWTTAPSIALIAVMIAFAIIRLRRWPVLSFAVLFFFLTHVIESSVLPLEMIFEHRNYLPAMFIFWPVAAGLKRLVTMYREKAGLIYGCLVAFIVLLIIGLGVSTYIRNIAWSTEKHLWEDALQKAPNSARPYIHLAWSHYDRRGDHQTALLLYHQALEKRHDSRTQYAKLFNNIANIYMQAGDCSHAVEYWEKSHQISEKFYIPRWRLAMALARCDRFEEALLHLNAVIAQKPDFCGALNFKGIIRLLQGHPQEALGIFRRCIKLDPANANFLLNAGAAFYEMADYRKAGIFFRQALHLGPSERIVLLWNAQNCLSWGRKAEADVMLNRLVKLLPFDELNLWLKMGYKVRVYAGEIIFPAADERLIGQLDTKFRQRLQRLEELTPSRGAEIRSGGVAVRGL